ncbi:molybdopterin molybdotransferase MoeA [Neolewinella agarilytica]|uniref:Molybdopterin molybdenumtransferase n=1 Tax=Neolewinella agarilytica TaxID=478744 RepID=A0A1H9HR14_9BACT|nr:molybdopterin molybdotransferase MoeA [Neolewinella agarilytica]SEQ64789.1 molybdopterin molybdochelatase [Neolewinella agarilytica]
MLITHTEATDILAQQDPDWGTETVALGQAAGRVLRQTLRADRDQPPFNRVAMDGICIDYAAYAAGQRFFPVAWMQAAGQSPRALTDATKCIEIMTGAALPEGATTVIRYEDLRAEGGGFHLPEGVEDGKSIHYRGKDIEEGAELATPGCRIGIAEIGMLATCGYAEVEVSALPRTAIIATGNELVDVAARPLPHQIRMSNLFQLREVLRGLGIEPALHHLPDEPERLRESLSAIVRNNELVMLSGGVSKGKLDYVPGILQELGVEKLFHGVAQRPGKPLWAGRLGDTMVFGLPGNPISSVNCTLGMVMPFLRQRLHMTEPNTVFAALTEALTFKPSLTLFQLVSLKADPESGQLLATPTPHAGSGDAASLLRSDGFLELPAERAEFAAGEVFRVLRL